MGYNSKALGGTESYETGVNGLIYKVHTFHTHDEGILVVAEAALAISCNGVPTASPSLWPPDYYPPVATMRTCPLPMAMSYPVDIVLDERETSTHMQCVPCPRGTFSAYGGTEDDCTPCPAGQYQDRAAASSCDGCPPGSWTLNGGDACIPCQPETYQVGNGCVPCPEGHYTLGIGASACIPCPINMWSNNASGGCRACPREATSPGGTGVRGCLCSEGNLLLIFRNTPYCVLCDKGTYGPTGSNLCLPCPPGTFGNLTGMHICFQCQSGYVARGGSTTCSLCGPGTIPAPDQSGCSPCPVGKYCEGNSSMADCPLGTFMITGNISSLRECQPCPADFFCETPTTSTRCPTGTYSQPGSVIKHDCLCLDEYDCQYGTITTKRISIDINPSDFESNQAKIIASLAAALGVSVDQIKIVSVQNAAVGLRRVLRGRHTLVTISVTKKRHDMLDSDTDTRKQLIARGIPAVAVITLHRTLDF